MVLVVVLGVSSRLVSNMIMDSASIVILVMIFSIVPWRNTHCVFDFELDLDFDSEFDFDPRLVLVLILSWS